VVSVGRKQKVHACCRSSAPASGARRLLDRGRCEVPDPANIVLAVAEKEAGKPGQWVRNTNGTHDVGPMQFNTAYLRDLARYGITPADVAAAGCYAFDLAAWRLRQHIRKDRGDLWTRAANYHSRTPQYNAVYRADLLVKAGRWADWLEARFVTEDVTKVGALPSSMSGALATVQPGSGADGEGGNEGHRDAGTNAGGNGCVEYLRVCPAKSHHRRTAMSNALKVSGESDGHVLPKTGRAGGMAIGAWPSLENQASAQHDQRRQPLDAHQAARWSGAGLTDCSTRSRISLPAWKCGTYFSATATGSPLFGLRPVRAGR
jgi:hypothetical protein